MWVICLTGEIKAHKLLRQKLVSLWQYLDRCGALEALGDVFFQCHFCWGVWSSGLLANYNSLVDFESYEIWILDDMEKSEDGDETLGLVVVKHSKIFCQQKCRLTFQEFWMKGAKCGVYFIQTCNQSKLLHVRACMIISLVRLWGLFTTWLYMYHRLRLVWTSPSFVQQQFQMTHGSLCPHNDLIKYTAKWSCKREWFKFKYLKW